MVLVTGATPPVALQEVADQEGVQPCFISEVEVGEGEGNLDYDSLSRLKRPVF